MTTAEEACARVDAWGALVEERHRQDREEIERLQQGVTDLAATVAARRIIKSEERHAIHDGATGPPEPG